MSWAVRTRNCRLAKRGPSRIIKLCLAPTMNKIDNFDKGFVALNLTSETEVLLENLPAKGTIHFQVIAFNAAGESAKSTEARVTLS